MFTLKKTMAKSISSTLACAMILGTTLLPSQALTKDELVDGVEYRLSTRNYSTDSMVANDYYKGVINTYTTNFHPDAEVEVDEDEETFTLTLYIANDENILFFNNIVTVGSLYGSCHVEYDGIDYSGDILASYDNALAPQKVFENEPSSGWVKMTAGETYGCDVITVSGIPVEALEDDGLKFDYLITAQFGNPMSMNQKLETGIVLDYEEVPEVEPIVEEKQVTITATKTAVTAPAPDYSITIPEKVEVPALVAGEDATISYAVTVDLGTATSVTVSSCTEGVLTSSGKDELPFTNSFTTETCTVGGLKHGSVTISKDAIAQAVAGDYTGTINFAFSFTA